MLLFVKSMWYLLALPRESTFVLGRIVHTYTLIYIRTRYQVCTAACCAVVRIPQIRYVPGTAAVDPWYILPSYGLHVHLFLSRTLVRGYSLHSSRVLRHSSTRRESTRRKNGLNPSRDNNARHVPCVVGRGEKSLLQACDPGSELRLLL